MAARHRPHSARMAALATPPAQVAQATRSGIVGAIAIPAAKATARGARGIARPLRLSNEVGPSASGAWSEAGALDARITGERPRSRAGAGDRAWPGRRRARAPDRRRR